MNTKKAASDFLLNKLDETQPDSNRPPTPEEVISWLIEFAEINLSEVMTRAHCNICNTGSEICILDNIK